MKAIGIHLPERAQFSGTSDRIFVTELFKTLKASGHYIPLRLDLRKLSLATEEEALSFLKKKNLAAIIQHDSAFYSSGRKYKTNAELLRKHVRFFNSMESQEIGHDKIATKRLLREKGISVLDDSVLSSPATLLERMRDGALYVAKPHNGGAGAGVRLIRRNGERYSGYTNGKWRDLQVTGSAKDDVKSIRLQHRQHAPALLLIGAVLGAMLLALFVPGGMFLGLMLVVAGLYLFIHVYDRGFTYTPMLLEPYFNDDDAVFTSLRCTVIGDEAVEAVKRTNRKNVTSNIASGGKAERFELSEAQERIAVAAKNAIGADYAGVDLLTKGDETVVGEVNIGPFTLFCTYSGANVGRSLGEYVIARCDSL